MLINEFIMGKKVVLISGFLHSLAILTISDKAQLFASTMMRKDRLQKILTIYCILSFYFAISIKE